MKPVAFDRSTLTVRSLHGHCRSMIVKMLVAFSIACLMAVPAFGQQLSEEMRGIFAELMPQLDKDLRNKIQDAINNDRDYLELTVDEFERFRNHPDNPFDGWQGIDTTKIKGTIRVQFESEPIRSRETDPQERQSTKLLDSLVSVARRTNSSTVKISNGTNQVALGMVFTDQGHVVTKLSELEGCDELYCNASDGQRFRAEWVAQNKANDIAILKIREGFLPPAIWATNTPEPGSILITTNGDSRPLAIGICSNPPRSLIGENQAFLGIKPVDDTAGIRVVEVTAGSSADDAGLLAGDTLIALNGRSMSDVQSLVNEIRRNTPGDKMIVDYLRNGQQRQTIATLAGRNVGGPTADRFKQMETFGAIPSKRRDEFPLVFQHDTPLVPEQCGGPVTNLDGEVVGINIARGGRVASYAIPADHLQVLLGEMLRPNMASRDSETDK